MTDQAPVSDHAGAGSQMGRQGPPRRGAPTTVERSLRRGPPWRRGSEGEYRRLVYGPGEPRLARDDLAGDDLASDDTAGGAGPPGGELVSLLHIGHLTDMQIADVQSPARFEFLERLRGLPGAEVYVPAWRPQEALIAQAVAAMVSTLNGLRPSAETGAPLGLCLSTGDNVDNAQYNELQVFLRLLGGGTVEPGPAGRPYQGVQAPGWQPGVYWSPEAGADPYKSRFGFPAHPGLLEEALRPFASPGLSVPWLSCFGNHDGLVLGTALPSPRYEEVLRGPHKAADLPAGVDPFAKVEEFTSSPEVLLGGHHHPVAPDPGRRSISRQEFVRAHLQAGGSPNGHGFDDANVRAGTAYGVYDIDGPVPVRVVLLDTTNMDGYFQGSIGARQLRWLEERLVEVHSAHYDHTGRAVSTGAADRLVVLASHHGLSTMVNDRQRPEGSEDDHPRVLAAELEALLHRFGNVVLWLNGHRHLHDVQPRPDPAHRTGGFWEVSTGSMADWPCQARLVELVTSREDELTILCTMVDAAVPPDPAQATGTERLASLHRELAANDPFAGGGRGLEGRPLDRNAALRLRAPFRLA